MQTSRTISRRELFSRFFCREADVPASTMPQTANDKVRKVAIIQGRHCLAYQSTFCSVCVERCPEPGAIISERGIPRVVADKCTGCRICHEVCPAPINAILLIPPKPVAANHS